MAGGKYADAAMAAMQELGVSPEDDLGEVTATRKAEPAEEAPAGSDGEMLMQMFEEATADMDPNTKAMLIDSVMSYIQEQMMAQQQQPYPQQMNGGESVMEAYMDGMNAQAAPKKGKMKE